MYLVVLQPAQQEPVLQYTYTQFREQVRNGNVERVTIRGEQIRGELKNPQQLEGREQKTNRFETTRPPFDDSSLMDLLDQHGVNVEAESAEGPWWQTLLVSLLPWLLILGFFIFITYRLQQRAGQMGGGIFSAGKSPAKRYRKDESAQTTFEEVAGLENAKQDLREVVDFLKDPDKYRGLGAKVPRGTLLMGPPGTGKTLLARAVAGEADVPFFSISGSEFIEMFVGVGASRVRDMFKQAKQEAPAIIFIDEIDSVGRSRGTGLGGGHDEREQTLNQILSEMDGFSPHEAVVVMAGTNRPDVLDSALLRPGRFDRKITLELPRRSARKEILKVHTRKTRLGEDVDLDHLAAGTPGFSGADLENMVNEAAMFAARKGKERIEKDDFEEARDKLILGSRRQIEFAEEERQLVAYHEAGHTLLAALLPKADPIRKVTIIPRGHALGATEQIPEEERQNLSRSRLLDRMTTMLGGRASERLVFGEESSGADNDLQQATKMARAMVSRWGMSDKLGAASFRLEEDHIFLGREMAKPKNFSEHTAQLIDDEIMRILTELDNRADNILRENRAALDALAQRLLEEDTVEEPALSELIEANLSKRPDAAEN